MAIERAIPIGGLSNTKLALATATEADVVSGKTFYAGNRELKTGKGSTNPSNLFFSMKPTTSSTDTITYGTITTGGSVTYPEQAADIFNITKTDTTGFSLKGTGYVRWEFPEPRTVQSWFTRTTYSYLGELMVYGEKSDGTLIALVTGYASDRGYGNNNSSMLDYRESVDQTTKFVAVRMMNPRSNTSYVVRPMFMFWLG